MVFNSNTQLSSLTSTRSVYFNKVLHLIPFMYVSISQQKSPQGSLQCKAKDTTQYSNKIKPSIPFEQALVDRGDENFLYWKNPPALTVKRGEKRTKNSKYKTEQCEHIWCSAATLTHTHLLKTFWDFFHHHRIVQQSIIPQCWQVKVELLYVLMQL